MSALWDREQREWLQAMGLTWWVRADGDDRSAPAPATASQAARAEAAALFATDAPPRPAVRVGASADRLLRAVLRAANLRPEDGLDPELAARVDPERLRGDAAAKRALWPYLRALRRGTRG
ncbi:MAG TPA: hypothetical protein VEY50_11160 [Lysobacter sp.]|nr:hypothetical protein [Lysobacter sp.]